MRTLLDDVLRVKTFHETSAENEVRRRQFLLEEAAKRASEARRTLDEYHDWRVEREGELYDSIVNQLVRRRDLENLRTHIAQLREKELALEHEASEAEKVRVSALKELEEAKMARLAAVREADKIRKLVDEERVAMAKVAEHREELELEDFRPHGSMEQLEELSHG